MVRITLDLLRRRSEHNEGELGTLEEVSLHQFDIERIELLDKHCRHLKIIYLQNNVIPRMENLNRLKELEYLNLALNNIEKIEGIERCESLKKLDLTLNFIKLKDLEVSCKNLSAVRTIEQLYLTGNPCTDWNEYRKIVIALVPQLKQLDSIDITHSERLESLQDLPSLLDHLKIAINEGLYEKDSPYTKEARLQMAEESQKIQQEKEREKQLSEEKQYGIVKKPPVPIYNDKGEIRQSNQGGYEYAFSEKHEKDKQYIILEIAVPKYLDTSQIDVDLNPTYIRVDIKGKILQLSFPCEVSVNDSQAKRSQITGSLQLTMRKVVNSPVPYFFLKEELETKKTINKPGDPASSESDTKPGEKSLGSISRDAEAKKTADEEPWEDDPDVPPLE